MSTATKLPEDPVLRHLAEVLEANGAVAEVYDHKWRLVHLSTEVTRMMAISAEAAESYMGISLAVRTERYPETWQRRRTRPLRCGREDSNLHGLSSPPGPKPDASTSSATSAGRQR